MYALDTAWIATPVGTVRICGDDETVSAISIHPRAAADRLGEASEVRKAIAQVCAYFSRDLKVFDLKLAAAPSPRGEALRGGMVAIGYGETLSYGALSRLLASSARAVGQACARNPFPIVVPCHRVLNADGSLGAYSGGQGPPTKRWLLDFERRPQADTLL